MPHHALCFMFHVPPAHPAGLAKGTVNTCGVERRDETNPLKYPYSINRSRVLDYALPYSTSSDVNIYVICVAYYYSVQIIPLLSTTSTVPSVNMRDTNNVKINTSNRVGMVEL